MKSREENKTKIHHRASCQILEKINGRPSSSGLGNGGQRSRGGFSRATGTLRVGPGPSTSSRTIPSTPRERARRRNNPVDTPVLDIPRGAFHLVWDSSNIWCFDDTETDNFVCTSFDSSYIRILVPTTYSTQLIVFTRWAYSPFRVLILLLRSRTYYPVGVSSSLSHFFAHAVVFGFCTAVSDCMCRLLTVPSRPILLVNGKRLLSKQFCLLISCFPLQQTIFLAQQLFLFAIPA